MVIHTLSLFSPATSGLTPRQKISHFPNCAEMHCPCTTPMAEAEKLQTVTQHSSFSFHWLNPPNLNITAPIHISSFLAISLVFDIFFWLVCWFCSWNMKATFEQTQFPLIGKLSVQLIPLHTSEIYLFEALNDKCKSRRAVSAITLNINILRF